MANPNEPNGSARVETAPDGRLVHRLKHRKQFLKLAAQGHKAVASTMVLQGAFLARESEDSGNPPAVRVGFTVTKKQGNAVARNRIRRRLKAAAAEVFPELGQSGWDYVVIGRHTAQDAPYEILLRDMRYTVRKLSKNQGIPPKPTQPEPV